jgi:ribosomal protein L11
MEIVKIKGQRPEFAHRRSGFRVIAGTARQMGLEIVD